MKEEERVDQDLLNSFEEAQALGKSGLKDSDVLLREHEKKVRACCPNCRADIKIWNGGRAECRDCDWKGYYPIHLEKIDDKAA